MADIDLNNLDLSNIGSWPLLVKGILIAVVAIAVLTAGYFLDIQTQQDNLARVTNEEKTLKEDFEIKQAKAANLDAYKAQMVEMEDSFGAMIRQLPSKTEVEDLLVDISQTGLASGIEFQLFKPLAEKHIEFYAELPITLKMTGTYHQFGEFVSGIAALPRIVTLENISIAGGNKDTKGNLTMDVTAKTYRYLDESEVSGKRKERKKRGK
ncbi:MAG: type 4a pilus biogenesis protein PilO [Gammaproteobacteria bacterium]|nr:type 4a pilus biogenesis protein PilO [Gammaproteobacteria bacterium]MCW8987798.1 type 4a pilus biogenesis protein PilO [Gammaproteobacteria bacterium]